MPESAELFKKIYLSDPEIKAYIKALKAKNAQLHRRMSQLEAEKISVEIERDAVKAQYETLLRQHAAAGAPTEAELLVRITALGYRVEKVRQP